MADLTSDAIARVFREEYGRVVAGLVRLLGNIDLAEESVQEAFVVATQRWPETGLPPNPGAWITVTARNRALDRLRRESTRANREQRATMTDHNQDPFEDDAFDEASIVDDRLRLIFTCCHPALAPDAQVALTLRLLGGLHASEIARAFLVPEVTMRQRITRAKRKIAANNIPYQVPEAAELPERLAAVLAVVYLVFNEGYIATSGEALVRDDLCMEAIRLGRILVGLMPDEPEAKGLLALMLLTAARRSARAADGELVQLRDQDRDLWDQGLIAEGHDLVRACLRRNHPGPYQIQAAINAVHTDAATAADTDWHQVVQLYEQLMQIAPSPVVAMNKAIAIAELDGPDVGLAALEGLPLDQYQPYHSTRADLLRRAGRKVDAAEAYRMALAITTNDAERRFLERRLAEVQ
ncbi:MAG TPA: RNA polymerase sigma factor [Ilumatobacter sp.]|jgi:RNA polymerase sigma-70 factor (ECF subfamily)|nr:RNA polymerase sigma factor [Ilumatobacter sp.]